MEFPLQESLYINGQFGLDRLQHAMSSKAAKDIMGEDARLGRLEVGSQQRYRHLASPERLEAMLAKCREIAGE